MTSGSGRGLRSGDTMGNMPFPVEPEDVYNAIVTANAIAKNV